MELFGRLTRLFLLICLTLCCAGCTANAFLPRNCSMSITDADITTNVQTRIVGDRGLADNNIEVSTYERVVTLSGKVDNPAQVAITIALARSVPGVNCVISRLKIKCQPMCHRQCLGPRQWIY